MEHLRFFTTVIETGSFTKAATKLGKDRSSIGQAVANLEIDLNCELFIRQGRSITPTAEALSIYPKARTLLQGYQSFCQFSENVAFDLEDHLTIGFDQFTSTEDIVQIETTLNIMFPQLIIHWLRASGENSDAGLAVGKYDLVIRLFQNRDLPEDYHILHLDNAELVGVANTATMIELGEVIHHNDLRSLPCLYYPDLNKVLRSDRFQHVQNVDSPQLALELLKQKRVWSLLPKSIVTPCPEGLVIMAVDTDVNLFARRVAVWHHSQHVGKAKRWLLDNLSALLQRR